MCPPLCVTIDRADTQAHPYTGKKSGSENSRYRFLHPCCYLSSELESSADLHLEWFARVVVEQQLTQSRRRGILINQL